jgi:DNA polymerase-3 subunit delta
MILFLYGPDTYRSRQKLNEIINHYQKIHKSGFNLKYFDLEKDSFQQFKEAIDSLSMFKEKKLLVLKNASSNLDFKEKFLKDLKRFQNSKEIILFYEKELPLKDDFFEKLKKVSRFQEFNFLEGERLKIWVKNKFKDYQKDIKIKALEKLIDYLGNNLWQIDNEIKKLVLYKKEGIIEEKDIDILVRPEVENDIFKTIKAVASKNKKRALSLLRNHLEKGDSPHYILAMLNFQFRSLLIVRDFIEKKKPLKEILKKIPLSPLVIKKSYFLAQKFSFQELKKIYQELFQLDFQIKVGKIKPETALELFIAKL